MARPITRLYGPEDVTEDVARAANDLRLRHVVLKDPATAEEDFARFSARIRSPGGRLALLFDADGHVRGSLHCRAVRMAWEGRQVRVAVPEYAFLDPDLRASRWMGFILLRQILWSVGFRPGQPAYIVCPAYLPSYLSFCRDTHTVWLLADPDVPAFERGLLAALAPELVGDALDVEASLVRLATRPRNPVQAVPRGTRTRAAYEHYLRRNPDWADGNAVVLMVPIKASAVVRGLASLSRRRLALVPRLTR